MIMMIILIKIYSKFITLLMKKLSICFLLVIYGSISFAQKNVIFNDDFEGYKNEWQQIKNSEFIVKQDQGKLLFSKANNNRIINGCLWYKKTIPNFNTEQNFSIEFEAKSKSSEFKDYFFDIQWGKLQEFDGVRKTAIYQIDFNADKVRLSRLVKPNNWQYFAWSDQLLDQSLSKFSMERNVSNKFEIIQQDGTLLIKINGILVYKLPIEVQNGSEIGFQNCLKSEWELDKITIKQ